LTAPERAWPAPDAGQIVWCRFPEQAVGKPGRKPRPALILRVYDDEAPVYRVLVAYGTSQKTQTLYSGEFRITPEDGEAYQLAGLSYPTKFSLARIVELPYTHAWFCPPSSSPFGQTPRLGVHHPSLHRRAAAAWQAVESSNT
jgi:hypothetical protein